MGATACRYRAARRSAEPARDDERAARAIARYRADRSIDPADIRRAAGAGANSSRLNRRARAPFRTAAGDGATCTRAARCRIAPVSVRTCAAGRGSRPAAIRRAASGAGRGGPAARARWPSRYGRRATSHADRAAANADRTRQNADRKD